MPAFAGNSRVLQLMMTALFRLFWAVLEIPWRFQTARRGRLFCSPPNARTHACYIGQQDMDEHTGRPYASFSGESHSLCELENALATARLLVVVKLPNRLNC